MKSGDIIFFEPLDWKGELIARWDGSPFSHVGLYWGEKDGVHLFVDADWDGVRVRPLKAEWRNYVTREPKREMRHALESIVLDFYGNGYDYTLIAQIALAKATMGLYRIPKTDAKRFICSELVNHVYGFMEAERATPATLWNILK